MSTKFEVGKKYVNEFQYCCECVHTSVSELGCTYVTMQFTDGSADTKVSIGWKNYREYVPPPKTYSRYFNLDFDGSINGPYICRKMADDLRHNGRISCQKVTLTEGVFDD